MTKLDIYIFSNHLHSDEDMLHVVHCHWILFYKQFIKVTLLGLVVPVLGLVLYAGFYSPVSVFLYLWIVTGLIFLVHSFFDWYGDAWLMTATSVIDVRWDGFFKRSATRVHYADIADVEYSYETMRQRLMQYGNISINRVVGGPVDLPAVVNPKKTSEMISQFKHTAHDKKTLKNKDALRNILVEMIEEHIRVKSD